MNRTLAKTWVGVLAVGQLLPLPALACAVCYGEPDAPMTRGLNWAILALGGVVAVVLAGVAGFFVYIQRRAARPLQSVPRQIKTSNF